MSPQGKGMAQLPFAMLCAQRQPGPHHTSTGAPFLNPWEQDRIDGEWSSLKKQRKNGPALKKILFLLVCTRSLLLSMGVL